MDGHVVYLIGVLSDITGVEWVFSGRKVNFVWPTFVADGFEPLIFDSIRGEVYRNGWVRLDFFDDVEVRRVLASSVKRTV